VQAKLLVDLLGRALRELHLDAADRGSETVACHLAALEAEQLALEPLMLPLPPLAPVALALP
jgi:hypothetical protein